MGNVNEDKENSNDNTSITNMYFLTFTIKSKLF